MAETSSQPLSVITGGAGFLGSHLTDRLLAEGHRVTAIDSLITGNVANIEHLAGNKNYKFICHDVTDFIYIPGKVDYVWHFASPASPIDYLRIPIPTLKVGSLGTHNALGLAKDKGAAFILASTSECYGDPLIHPQTEDYWGRVNPIGPRACYDEGKRAAETLFFDYNRQHGVKIRVARIFNTYGPRMALDDGRVVSNFIVQALKGEPITIYGEGLQTRSFCYVDDLLDGMIALMDTGPDVTGPINVGNPNEFTMIELAEAVLKLAGSKSKLVKLPLPADDPKQRQPNIAQARSILGWEPKVQLEDGLKETIAYFRGVLAG
jgi:nucleoside-diphosphate-sugar epimerase